jgi:GR25 family glycosyltransferase involved in LPS biosynthesis
MEPPKDVSNKSDIFATAIIVFERSRHRMGNYHHVKENIIPDIIFFPAADSINDFEKHKARSLEMNYHTDAYLKKYPSGSGKLGCNMSHIELLQHFKTLPQDWFLVLEDDVQIENYDTNVLHSVIEAAKTNNSHYVHLYTNPDFRAKQFSLNTVAPDLYPMIKQWHTIAYLIDKRGIDIIFSKFPYNEHIDHIYSNNIKELNATCYMNTMFKNGGAEFCNDKSSKFGSLIYKLRGKMGSWWL